LGVGTAAAPIFNGSIIVLGLLLVLCAWFIFRGYRDRFLLVALAIAGIGAAGVGTFTEGSPFGLHSAFSLITFVFAALATILAFRIVRPPLGYLSIAVGVASVAALGLYVSGNSVGLGPGGRARMIVRPVLGWGMRARGAAWRRRTEPAACSPAAPVTWPRRSHGTRGDWGSRVP